MRYIQPILILLFYISTINFVTAYMVVHSDTFDYSISGMGLTAYGFDAQGTNLSYCSASSGALTCDTGVNGISPTIYSYFNNVPTNYCPTASNLTGGDQLNVSLRFSISCAPGSVNTTGGLTNINIRGNTYATQDSGMFKMDCNASNSPIGFYNWSMWMLGDNSSAVPIMYRYPPHGQTFHDVQIDMVGVNYPASGAQNNTFIRYSAYLDGSPVEAGTGSLYWMGAPLPPYRYTCFNQTALSFSNDGFSLDNLYVIVYENNETFVNPNTTLILITECSDGNDNDGDGLIDYPNDPACINSTSLTESPQNLYQCNDGVDNDVDGLLDYPQDTGCSNYNDNSELPKSGTAQLSDECSQGTACLYKDTFPYTDGIEWHGWSYDIDYSPPTINCSVSSTCNTLTPLLYVSGTSNYDLRLTAAVNTNFQRVTLYRNFSNTNSYDNAVFKIVTAIKRTSAITNESIHEYIRYGTSTLAEIRIDFTTAISGAYRTKAYIWATSGGQYYLAGTAYLNDDYDGILETIIVTDQVNGSYKLYFVDETSSIQQTTDNTYYFTTSNVPDNLYIESDADNMDLWVKEVHGYGVPEGSVCTSFTKPYYLKEEFIYGFLTDCGWIASDNFVMLSELEIDQSLGQFDAYKTTSEDIEQTKFRYVTIEWDEYISSTQPTSNPVNNIYLKDADGNLIVQVYFMPDGKLYSVPDLTPDQVTTISTETYVNIKLVLDLLEEQFNLYIDDSLFTTLSQVPFYDSDYDTQTLRYFSISSLTSNYKMDNIQIYTSDSTGGQLVGTDEITTRVYKNDVLGLWFKNTTKCATDDDCESGQCQPYGTCSQFNFKACDEEKLPRGNWCMIRLTTGRTLENAGDIMLDNFLYLVVFIVILMILLYIAIMFRR